MATQHGHGYIALQWLHNAATGSQHCHGYTALPWLQSTAMATQHCKCYTALQMLHSTATASQHCHGYTALPRLHQNVPPRLRIRACDTNPYFYYSPLYFRIMHDTYFSFILSLITILLDFFLVLDLIKH